MSLEQNSIILSEVFEQLITNPKIDVCTEELKGSSILDVNILRILKKNGVLPIKKLGAALELPPSTLGSAIKRLEKNNLVERKINSNDLRSYLICMTEHGDEVISSINKEQQKLMERLLSSLAEDEQNTFLELLQRMLQTFLN
ncbi:MAG: MarR family transcriptional regulator [Lachnospiraceae bacterium]|nr:MarR family transcriptional regulator [Candidatus Colinaster equi]